MSPCPETEKWKRRIRSGITLAAAFCGMSVTGVAQRRHMEEQLQRHEFVFIAERAAARAQPGVNLIPTYELRVTSDSVDGRLPFYGRVYSPSEALSTAVEGFTIRSRLKSYELRKKRNGSWQLTLETLSGNNVQKLAFDVSRNGFARLSINSALRDMMFYEGRIAPVQTP